MRRLIIVSGAGLSVGSGVPAFRTDTDSGKALWDEYDLAEVCDIHAFSLGFTHLNSKNPPLEALSKSPKTYGKNLYTLTNEFYNKRREDLASVEPNIAHLRIAEWFHRYHDAVLNVTTNVDDLLERAGIPHDEILHVHGYLPEIKYKMFEDTVNPTILDIGHKKCNPDLFHWAKPNVVFFGEHAPEYPLMHSVFDSLTANDMVIVVGASNQVINFNWELFPAQNMGTKMVVVNPGINYLEQELYEERGVLVYRDKANNVFSSEKFINMVESFMEGKINAGK